MPGPIRVKICGICSEADARGAIDAGADALGFNFWPGSKRALDFHASRGWMESLPPDVARVAVVVNASAEVLRELQRSGIFHAIQFHGDETPAFCQEHGGERWIRAVRVVGDGSLGEAISYGTPWLLADAAAPAGAYGGTGERADAGLVASLVAGHPERHVILAGGLRPDNVVSAIRSVRPFGVDVASGVEDAPRRKNVEAMQHFVREAQGT